MSGAADGRLVLVAPTAPVRQALARTGLDQVLHIRSAPPTP
ncbi:hypothetical protein ACSNOI_46075 [Actinomadura kijaniata]